MGNDVRHDESLYFALMLALTFQLRKMLIVPVLPKKSGRKIRQICHLWMIVEFRPPHSLLPFQRLPLPPALVRRRFIGALHEVEQRLIG